MAKEIELVGGGVLDGAEMIVEDDLDELRVPIQPRYDIIGRAELDDEIPRPSIKTAVFRQRIDSAYYFDFYEYIES